MICPNGENVCLISWSEKQKHMDKIFKAHFYHESGTNSDEAPQRRGLENWILYLLTQKQFLHSTQYNFLDLTGLLRLQISVA